MELVCINNEPIDVLIRINPAITIGKSYVILDERKDEYYIKNDIRTLLWIPKYYFK